MSTVADTFHIVLQKGIEGGFAPPTPHALYTLARPPNSDIITVTTQTRPHGTPSLLPPNNKELRVADYIDTIANLQQLLRDLPPQFPGARDLYGRNTSIVQLGKSGGLLPSGSFAGSGVPDPTEEQRAQFDEAVGIIEKLVAA